MTIRNTLLKLFGGRRYGVVVTDPAGRQTVQPFTGNPGDVMGGDGNWQTGGGGGSQLPVGSVYIAVVPTNPASSLGYGIWELFARGRALVGIQIGDPDFGTVLQESGEKTHLLTLNEVPPWAMGDALSADPAAPEDGDWWVLASGTSPTRTLSLRIRDAGSSYTISEITV